MAPFNQHRRVTPLQFLLHYTCGRHTIRQTSSISLLFTTFISECSRLFVSEILKNVSSLRGDLPHAPGNMPSISTPGVGQPIPLRRFLPHHGQLLNDVDTWTHTLESRLPPLLFPQIPVGPCGNVTDFFLFLSLSLAYGIQSSFCQR